MNLENWKIRKFGSQHFLAPSLVNPYPCIFPDFVMYASVSWLLGRKLGNLKKEEKESSWIRVSSRLHVML